MHRQPRRQPADRAGAFLVQHADIPPELTLAEWAGQQAHRRRQACAAARRARRERRRAALLALLRLRAGVR